MPELRSFIVAIIMFGVIVTGLTIFMNGVFEPYGIDATSSFGGLYTAVNDSMQNASLIQEGVSSKIETGEGVTTPDQSSTNFGVSIYEAAKMSYQAFTFLPSLIFRLFETFLPGPVGQWLAGAFLTILMFLVAMWILSFMRGKDG